MAQQEGCSSPPRSLSRFSSLPTPFLHTHISRRARCTLAQLDNILSPCPLSALAVRQIPLSPPNKNHNFDTIVSSYGSCFYHKRAKEVHPLHPFFSYSMLMFITSMAILAPSRNAYTNISRSLISVSSA